ncbi:peptide ABC transporter substrate-binding protein [Virgibacillus sp. DJP39]|uniref:peptide ABC transporter substrate-binding protein n=1 Tax=Virgibacillus sp. DJP39 TaxID=3409790 RepID=UPI003BB7BE6A
MNKIKLSLLVTLGLLLSLLMAACSTNDESDKATNQTEKSASKKEDVEQVFNLINGDTIPTMDSALASDVYALDFLNASMEGLYRLGEDSKLTPGIAKDHTISKDGMTWTFDLREDAVWSNGDPVTAHDFVYAWQRVIDPETGSEYGPYMMGDVIKNAKAINQGKLPVDKLGVKALDDYTLEVTLQKPIPYFQSLTAFGTFLPLNQEYVEAQGEQYGTSTDKLLFNGPFILKDWKSTATSWNLEDNPEYWDADAVKLEKITYDVVKDPQTAVDLYEKGKVDRAAISSDLVDKYASHEDFIVTPEPGLFYLKFNQNSSEALANKNIRKAMSKAINKQALVDEVLNNGSTVSSGFIPKEFVEHPKSGKGFREINGELVTYDAEKAQTLWKKGLKEIGKENVYIEILSSDSATTKTLTEYIANQLETNLPGLEVTLKQVPFEQRIELGTSGEYEVLLGGWAPAYPDPYTFLNVWLTDGANNNMGYSNPEYDELIKSTVNELALDPVKRFEAFLAAEKILAEDAAVAPLYQSARAQLISPKIEGVVTNPTGAVYEYKWAHAVPTE